MAQYGEVRVDYITYTTGTSPSEANATVTVSSLVNNPNFSGNINVEGNGTIEGNLDVSGNADIHGDTILHGDLTVSGIIIGDQNFSGNINVQGSGTIEGDGIIEGNLDVSGNANIHGDTIISGDLIVSGNIIGDQATGIFSSGSATNPSITFKGDEDTGIYTDGAGKINFTNNGTSSLEVDEAGRLSLGGPNANDQRTYVHISGTFATAGSNLAGYKNQATYNRIDSSGMGGGATAFISAPTITAEQDYFKHFLATNLSTEGSAFVNNQHGFTCNNFAGAPTVSGSTAAFYTTMAASANNNKFALYASGDAPSAFGGNVWIETDAGLSTRASGQTSLHVGNSLSYVKEQTKAIIADSTNNVRFVLAHGNTNVSDIEFRKTTDTGNVAYIRHNGSNNLVFAVGNSDYPEDEIMYLRGSSLSRFVVIGQNWAPNQNQYGSLALQVETAGHFALPRASEMPEVNGGAYWTSNAGYYGVASSTGSGNVINRYGQLETAGSFGVHITCNGCRTTSGWFNYGADSISGASQVECNPNGYVVIRGEDFKPNLDTSTINALVIFRPEADGNREYYQKPDDSTQEYPFLSAADLGTGPTQVAQNWMLGSMAFQGLGINVDSVSFKNDQPYTSGEIGFLNTASPTVIDTKSLQHYEQGQWRGDVVNESGVIVTPSNLNSCRYTRIGNDVTLYASLQMTSAQATSMTADGNGDTPVRVCRIPYPIANMGSLKFVGTASPNLSLIHI